MTRTFVVAWLLFASPAVTRFSSYEQVFKFIAARESANVNGEVAVFKLAAESCVDYVRSRPDDWYVVIRADYLHNHISEIRGAQGNGPYYVFREANGAFTFIGVMHGNAYTQSTGTQHIGFDVSGHAGGGKTSRMHYEVIGDTLVHGDVSYSGK